MTTKTPRGQRSNNPGNIRHSKDKWQGMADKQIDKEFVTFKAPEWGIRAIARLLIRYQDKYNLNTIAKVIKRYAPPSENKTEAYIKSVSSKTGFGPNDVLDFTTYEHAEPMVRAIIRHELGTQPYDQVTINKGLMLAGIEPKKKPAIKSRTIGAQGVASASTLGAGAIEATQQIEAIRMSVAPLTEYLEVAKWIMLGLIILSAGLTVYYYLGDRKKRFA